MGIDEHRLSENARYVGAACNVVGAASPGVILDTVDSEWMARPVSTLDDAVERLTPMAADIRALGVKRLALFGSVLHGRARQDSDGDVLVGFAVGEKSYARFVALADLLEDAFGRPVELVTTEALSPHLGPSILAEARDVL